jgi:hypothetical protein
MTVSNQLVSPGNWWVKSRDRVILGLFVLMALSLMGLIPGPISALRDEHQRLLLAQQMTCYNHAELVTDSTLRTKQARRCLMLKLDD